MIALCLFVLHAGLAGQSNKPNIIFIMADDLGYGDLGCYGQDKIQTPNIDKLAMEGMRFTQAYAGSSVCAPSRCSLMTGMHNGHNRVRDNIPHGIFLQPDDFTLAELLKQAGYRTGGIGKYSLGDPGSWGVPLNQGFDYYYGQLNQDQAHFYYPHYLWENDKVELLSGNRAEQKKEYTQDLYTEKALTFIEENQQHPFFLYLPYTIPHFSDYPADTPDYYIVPSDEPYSDKEWSQTSKNYAAMITRLDGDVGKIMALLKEQGIDGNTLVIFTSDNGPLTKVPDAYEFFDSNGSLKGGKRELYEGGIRVPFIVRWKEEVPESAVSDEIITFWDIMPTFAEIIDYPAEIRSDGISFLPSLSGGAKEDHDYLYWDYGHVRKKYIQAVRYDNYKGIRNITRDGVDFELYDLAKDPGEENNIANRNADLVNKVIAMMDGAYDYNEAYPRKTDRDEYRIPALMKTGVNGVISQELIFSLDNKPTPQCHASTIEETATGLIASWFAGTHESHPDVGIWTAKFNGSEWSGPVEVADGIQSDSLRYPCWNPVLFAPEEGPLMLFYKVGPNPREWWGMLITSEDEGNTWSTPVKLGEDKLGHLIGPVKNKPVQLTNGSILCPSSTETKEQWKVHFELTKDLGKTWKVIGPINDGEAFDAIQPSILNYGKDSLQILCRTRQRVIGQSWSEDGGQTWTKMSATQLPNPNAGTDALTMKDGRQILIYNHTIRTPENKGRDMLNLAISTNGTDWKPVMTLESQQGEYSYPAIIQTSDGLLHITYTYRRQSVKHVVIDPDQISSP